MNAKDYIREVGWEAAEEVAKRAGTTRAYFSQIAHGHRNASLKLARRLVEAEPRLDLMSLMTAAEKSGPVD